MKVIVSDIHGRTDWQKHVNLCLKSPIDDLHIIFIGDYVDSFHIDPQLILENLKVIIGLKKKHPNKVTLLLGNHDYAYMFELSQISGYNHIFAPQYKKLFSDNWGLFDLAYGFGTFDWRKRSYQDYTLITHAGLTDYFFYWHILDAIKNKENTMHHLLGKTYKQYSLHEVINFFKDKRNQMWIVGYNRGGYYPSGSILWADMDELIKNPFKNINQIVGHTSQKVNITVMKDDKNFIYFTDNSGIDSTGILNLI